jgi:hypothetical protein
MVALEDIDRDRDLLLAKLGAGEAFTWIGPDVIATSPGSAVTLATGLPAGALCSATPTLLPGQALQVSGTTLQLVSGSTTPLVDGSTPGSYLDTVSARDIVIEVMDSVVSPMIRRVTAGRYKEYPSDGDYSHYAYPGRWNTLLREAIAGDEFEVAPGCIHAIAQDFQNQTMNSVNDGGLLTIDTPIGAIRNMPGRGRWSLYPGTEVNTDVTRSASGILLIEPEIIGGRANLTIEGFEFDNWSQSGFGVRVRENYTSTSSWTDYHQSLTLRNFKIGKAPWYRSASGLSGKVETWNVENGHVYDTGAVYSGGSSGHNAYIEGRVLNMFGMLMERTRRRTPDGTKKIDGHILKLTFNHMLVEGNAIVGTPAADNTCNIQCKGGGNLVVRGNLIIHPPKYYDVDSGPNQGSGLIRYVRETPGVNDGGWKYGLAGHSLLVEKNLFISHYPYEAGNNEEPLVSFIQEGHPLDADTHPVLGMTSCVIRDNIGMAQYPSAGWVRTPPAVFGGGTWASNGNIVLPYDANEAAFEDRLLRHYTTATKYGDAVGGSIATKRFVWPHGHMSRTDALRGLG